MKQQLSLPQRAVRTLRQVSAILTSVPDPGLRKSDRLSAYSVPLVLVLAAVWVGAWFWAFSLKSNMLLWDFDGVYARNLMERQTAWRIPLTTLSLDFYHGIGDLFFLLNTRLFPAFQWIVLIGDAEVAKVVGYLWVVLELSLSALLFFRSFGLPRHTAIVAASLIGLVSMPIRKVAMTYLGLYLSLAPHMGTSIAVALVMAAAITCFGHRGLRAGLGWAVVYLAGLYWNLVAGTFDFIVVGPCIGLLSVAAVIAAEDWRERRLKLGLIAAAGLMMAAGPAAFFAGLLFDTAATFYSSELVNDRMSLDFGSILFHREVLGKIGPLLFLTASAGALLACFNRQSRGLRVLGMLTLVFQGCLLALSLLALRFDFWRGPSPLYFEFAFIPLYVMFATYLTWRLFAALWPLVVPNRPVSATLATSGIVLVASVLLVYWAATTYLEPLGSGLAYPPKPTVFTSLLAEESGLKVGAAFRGRTANMLYRSNRAGMHWYDMHMNDLYLAEFTHNDQRAGGLYAFDIPGLFENTSTLTPAFYAVTSRLLALPEDGQMRASSTLRNLDPRILALLGVRFVITDAPFDGKATLRKTAPYGNDDVSLTLWNLYLYEIPNPNLGNYSPTTVTKLSNATEVLRRMADPAVDLIREVLVTSDLDAQGLVPASNARLLFEGTSIRVSAASAGRSILLVPLEYSRCLRLETLSGDPAPALFRANLLETGVSFSGNLDIRLSIQYGPYTNPACRWKDRAESLALGMRDIPRKIREPTDTWMRAHLNSTRTGE